MSAALVRAPLSSSPCAAEDRYAPLLYGLLAALVSAAITALLLGGAP